MNTKWIRHPNLSDGQEVEVPAQSVGHYSHSGWIVMDEPPEWATVRPEDATLAELTAVARDAAGMPETPAGRERRDADELRDLASKASGTDEASDSDNDETDDKEKPTVSRTRRAPTKGDK